MTLILQRIINFDKILVYIFSALFVPVMILGILLTSYGFIPIFMFGVIFLIIFGVIVGFISFLVEKRTHSKIYRWFYLVSKLSLISLVAFCFIAYIQGKVTDNRAKTIIVSLEKYHSDSGKYPTNLKQLETSYMAQIKPSAYFTFKLSFQGFEYTVINEDNFELYYHSYLAVEHTYNSEKKEWQVDD